MFGVGRKLVLTLALFLLVFAAASVVKIQAAGNVTGWLWGGSEDANLVPPPLGSIDGNDTKVYSVSMNKLNCDSDNNGLTDAINDPDCPVDDPSNFNYGVTIPASSCSGNACKLSGHAWSSTLGYLSFEETELNNCPSGDCWAWRDGDTLKGWARFMEFKINAAQAGGWGGWVSLSNPSASLPYGVNIINGNEFQKCNPSSGNYAGCAWSGETPGNGNNMANGLGWIDFSEAKIGESLGIVLTDITLRSGNNPGDLYAQLIDSDGNNKPLANKKIDFSEDSDPSDKISLLQLSCMTDVAGGCKIQAQANLDSDANGVIKGQCSDGSCGFDTSNVTIIQDLDCVCSAPSSISIVGGSTTPTTFPITITPGSDVGCALAACNSLNGTLINASASGSNCEVSAVSTSTRYGCTKVRATTNGGENCTPETEVCIKGPGWIETNP